jgi:hypothetical protein
MDFVKEYLDGEMDRIDFELDFNYYLIENYPAMEREDSGFADCFLYYISEEGFDRGGGLGDGEHKQLIRRQWDELHSAIRDGIY